MKRILVVEDDVIMRETLIDILRFEGYDVSAADGGHGALEKICSSTFDLIVTDVLMPDRDGFDVITEAKQKCPEIKVIAISGGGYISSDSYLKMASEAGADDTLSKPFDVDELLLKTKELLREAAL
ncbi:MAG: response regulator [Bacteroidales bacterium]